MKSIDQLKKNIHKEKLIKKGDKIVIGVSGGADSIALCCILNELKYDIGFQIHLAHVDHNLRASSKDDKKCVQELAQKLNLPLDIETWKHPKTKQPVSAIEEKARVKRISFFIKLARKINAQKIALAHTKDDVAETVLMNLMRGSGLKGLRGIIKQRELNGMTFIRPLLDTPKADLLKYLDKKGIAFVTDPTNLETNFTRNKIRLKLLPQIRKDYNANIDEALSKTAQWANHDYDFLDKQARLKYKRIVQEEGENTITLDQSKFLKLHPSMKNIILRSVIEKLCGSVDKITAGHIAQINEFVCGTNAYKQKLQLPYRINVDLHKNRIRLYTS